MLVTRKQVEQNLGQVTSDQIARCTRVYDYQLQANIYMVLSESDDLTEYRVTYQHKCYCCTCPSGSNGFSNVRHASGVCKHVRWAVAAAQEAKAAEEKEQKIASARLSLEQSQTALRQWGLKQTDVEMLQHHVASARSELARLTANGKTALQVQIDQCRAEGRPTWFMTGLPTYDTRTGNTVYPAGWNY